MSPSPADDGSATTGPPDRQTLRLLEQQLVTDSLVSETRYDPDAYEPRLLVVLLAPDQYPDSVTVARLDIRWFTTGDFSIHYVEEHRTGDQWECRWDRHPNTHNSRLHFHQPPAAAEITDLSLPSLHPLDVYSTVFAALEARIENSWSAH